MPSPRRRAALAIAALAVGLVVVALVVLGDGGAVVPATNSDPGPTPSAAPTGPPRPATGSFARPAAPSATVTNRPGTRPDLRITTSLPGPITVGNPVTATVTVTNVGGGAATGVVVRVDAGSTLRALDPAAGGAYPLGALAPGEHRTVGVPLVADRPGPRVPLSTSVTSDQPDLTPGDNADLDLTGVVR